MIFRKLCMFFMSYEINCAMKKYVSVAMEWELEALTVLSMEIRFVKEKVIVILGIIMWDSTILVKKMSADVMGKPH